MTSEIRGWTAVYIFLAVSWVVILALYAIRGRKKSENTEESVKYISVPKVVWWVRLGVILFFVATLVVIFYDLELWALTRYTVWTLLCSLVYLCESHTFTNENYYIKIRPVVLCFCLAAELVVGIGYWSLYGDETYIPEESVLNQYHSTAAHLIIQIVLLAEFIFCVVTQRSVIPSFPFASTLLYLSTYMILYATAVFSFAGASDSTLPYEIIDPRKEGTLVVLWMLIAWTAHASFVYLITAVYNRDLQSFSDCNRFLHIDSTPTAKSVSQENRVYVQKLIF